MFERGHHLEIELARHEMLVVQALVIVTCQASANEPFQALVLAAA